VGGAAQAGPTTAAGKLSKSKVKKIAIKQINKAAPGLSVASAQNADTAEHADTAADASNLGGSPPGAFQPTVRWAVVEATNAGASVVRGNATGARRVGVGQYVVSFAPDIRDCAYVATNGDIGAGFGHEGEIDVGQFASNNATDVLAVHTSSAGATTDYGSLPGEGDGFHIAVLC
jgi:hypothetical protein